VRTDSHDSEFDVNHQSALFGYLYPSYATFKALAGRPATEPQIEGWAFYWSVVGILVAAEELFEWFFNW
jgi:receptor expression-enhancing protein 1/2/3/4